MKPLGRKNYGSIGHLPCSRMGPSDHHVHEGQQRICIEKARDKHDIIIVTEKLDGSNVGIANVDGEIVALGRSGYLAQTSKYEQHQLFADWVRRREAYWKEVLDKPGQRLVGEWLAQAHGTRYSVPCGPFVAFDFMNADKRYPFTTLDLLCMEYKIPMPALLHRGGPIGVDRVMQLHSNPEGNIHGWHSEDGPEGVVYRVERKGEFDFMAKWVRPDKVDGKYLPEISGKEGIWNWQPQSLKDHLVK